MRIELFKPFYSPHDSGGSPSNEVLKIAEDKPIQVRIHNLSALYQRALDAAKILGIDFTEYIQISRLVQNPINSPIIALEESSLGAYEHPFTEVGQNLSINRPEYQLNLHTTLTLGDARTSQPDKGYYGWQKLARLQSKLREKGLKPDVVTDTDFSELFVPFELGAVEINFGFTTVEEEEKFIRSNDYDPIYNPTWYENELRKLEEGTYTNNIIRMSWRGKSEDADPYHPYESMKSLIPPHIKTEGEYRQFLTHHATAVSALIQALHEVEGIPTPRTILDWKLQS